ncbi:hypothetical protein SCHPADRAFT_894816 [Schizopora paradoxa]|uniref:Uncharacterized protein n=1 Tax=Schizopora paradoxa TaxID=27342 RepID=A0A0H2R609_9AGAM|nr:hypothetical protein SCHPADRAFT_894816 [Schizopora paradoxa]
MAHREHVPAHAFSPSLQQGYRSDVAGNACPQMAPIRFGNVRLTDLLAQGANNIAGANDQVFNTVPYGVIKLHLSWPGYAPHDLIPIDLYAGGNRTTRASIAFQAARLFCRYLDTCKGNKIHPAATKWKLGQGYLEPRNIIINHLTNTYENVWQIDCDVVI